MNKIHNKFCRKCSTLLDDTNIYPSRLIKSDYICKKCSAADLRKMKPSTKEVKTRMNREYNYKLRLKILEGYGNKCSCCGENRREFLAIDHIDGGGLKHRMSVASYNNKFDMRKFYLWIIRNNFPPELRLLCHNCNAGTYFGYGTCPHIKDPNRSSRWWELHRDIVKGYGSKCICCEEQNIYFLTIDHIFGNKSHEKGGKMLYPKLQRLNYPQDEYQLMCYNCNLATGYYAVCPHNKSLLEMSLIAAKVFIDNNPLLFTRK